MRSLVFVITLFASISSFADTTIFISNPTDGHLRDIAFKDKRISIVKRHITEILTTFSCSDINYGEETDSIVGSANCDEDYQIQATINSTGSMAYSDYIVKLKIFQVLEGVRIKVDQETYIID